MASAPGTTDDTMAGWSMWFPQPPTPTPARRRSFGLPIPSRMSPRYCASGKKFFRSFVELNGEQKAKYERLLNMKVSWAVIERLEDEGFRGPCSNGVAGSRAKHTTPESKLTPWDTKTAAGTRTIILPPSTVELLRERKKSALTEWIFPNPLKPEQPTRPSAAYERTKALLKQAGLPDLRFHDLRHTFATHALASGVDVKTLSGILGHTRAAFTLDTYTHTTGDMQKRAAEIVEIFLTDIFGEELKPWEESARMARGL